MTGAADGGRKTAVQNRTPQKEAPQKGSLRGLVWLLTGDGKGKSTAAFGSVMRALGHGQRVGVVQFISGTQATGELLFLQQINRAGQVQYHAMATGYSWENTKTDKEKKAAAQAWSRARAMLADPHINLVVLDELTYMLCYGHLAASSVVAALRSRPTLQNVIITGRNAPEALREAADTVSEIANCKHAFAAGVAAQAGLEF